MNTFKFIDDHNGGREADFVSPVIGVWRNKDDGRIGVALGGMHCINELYIDEDGDLHLSTESIGPTAIDDNIARGVLGAWKLERMSLNKIYKTVKEAGQISPVL